MDVKVLLVSTYELGHQPLHVAAPAAALSDAGHDVRVVDLAIDDWHDGLVSDVGAVAFSVPMHTAMRLAMKAASKVRSLNPAISICFYGLYANVGRDATLGKLADALIAGEYLDGLNDWVARLDAGEVSQPHSATHLGRNVAPLPQRDFLPALDSYAHLSVDDRHVVAGYVEASHGCAHKCRHCPVPVVYDGRIRKVDAEIVLADIGRQVAAGAGHITFGDPDFLNGWRHSLDIVNEMHRRWPDLTFDVTTKVEHILHHDNIWQDMSDAGCLFVVSAFESVNDDVLELLDKGHTKAQASEAVDLLRCHNIEVRPSWLPFTPWTTVQDVCEILEFIVSHDLIGNTDPVQYQIRLLIPEGSLMLDLPQMSPFLDGYDPVNLTWQWSGDPEAEALQKQIASITQLGADRGAKLIDQFFDVWDVVRQAAGLPGGGRDLIPAGSIEGRPRLTEPWFC